MDILLKYRVYATVAYADIFNYPLTKDELQYWLITDPKIQEPQEILLITSDAYKLVERTMDGKDEYIYLPGKKHLIEERRKKKNYAGEKWRVAKRIVKILKIIPTVQLISVTGGLALDNTKYGDDIDLLFVVSKGTLWSSRLFITLLVELLGKRRRPNEKFVMNKICLNMYLATDALLIPVKERDLYIAHELLQMRPLYQRNDIYRAFLVANSWVASYLPLAWNKQIRLSDKRAKPKSFLGRLLSFFIISFMRIIELPCAVVQKRYMKKRKTKEVIRKGMIRFHPKDARGWVKMSFAERLQKHNIPLDNYFNAQ